MTGSTWHLDTELAGRYAGGRVDPVLAASVEQHLVRCAACRQLLEPTVDRNRLDAVFAGVLDTIEAPRPGLLERLLLRLGLEDSTARLIAVTPSLRGAWLTGVVVVLTLALVTAHADPHGVALFMTLAPVLPVVGVAFAFGPGSDPAHEIAAAAPYSTLQLLVLRSAFVVASTLVPTAVLAPLLPGSAALAVAWLLPALALTVTTVALATRFRPHLAAGSLSALWVALVIPGLAHSRDPWLAATPAVQLASLAALVLSAAVLFHDRHQLGELLRRTT
jgi:hypothetical protein